MGRYYDDDNFETIKSYNIYFPHNNIEAILHSLN